MSKPDIRKTVVYTEEIFRELDEPLARPLRVAAAMAVIRNPFAGKFSKDIDILSNDYSESLGIYLTDLAVKALGTQPVVFGKAALVGLDGEVQHGSAVIHTKLFGDALRRAADGNGVVPGAEKRAGAGASLDVAMKSATDGGTLANSDATSYFSFEVRVPDAPRDDEILVISVVGDGPRANPRRR